ncbi:MAG: helix-turn-helix transcriptional regulator [Clostridia bacterium]|nr:helix-turn-helix transcriptional regulator [Clostridia bacterium]
MKITNREFAYRLKKLRKENRLTQSEIAEKLNLSRTCIANWENGLRVPQYGQVLELSRIFGVPIDYFSGQSEHKYNINIPDYLEIDLSKLNGAGMNRMREYYEFLINDKKFCK